MTPAYRSLVRAYIRQCEAYRPAGDVRPPASGPVWADSRRLYAGHCRGDRLAHRALVRDCREWGNTLPIAYFVHYIPL